MAPADTLGMDDCLTALLDFVTNSRELCPKSDSYSGYVKLSVDVVKYKNRLSFEKSKPILGDESDKRSNDIESGWW